MQNVFEDTESSVFLPGCKNVNFCWLCAQRFGLTLTELWILNLCICKPSAVDMRCFMSCSNWEKCWQVAVISLEFVISMIPWKHQYFQYLQKKNDVFLLRDTVLHKFIRPPVVKKWENKSFFSKLHFIHFQSPLDILPFWTLKRNFKLNSHFYAQIWAESMFCSEKSEMNHNIQPASK